MASRISTMNRRAFTGAIGATGLAMVSTASGRAAPREKIRIGQIGVGHAHASKLAVYRASDDYEVVGVVEPNETSRIAAQGQAPFRDLPWMTREQLLNTPGLRAVLVETEVRDLLSTAEACVAAGKHVHIDKPAGASLPQFARIVAAAERQKLMIQVGYMYRYNPAIVLLRDFLKRGWLGEVFEIHAVMGKVVPAADRREVAKFSGGILFELGCHVLDLVIGVLGKPDEVIGVRQHTGTIDDGLLDNMLAVLRYPKAIASVKANANEIEGFARRHFVVCGTGGTFHIQPLDDPAARVALAEPRGPYKAGYQEIAFPKYTRYVDDAADMAKVIRGEKESDFSGDHDLLVQETLLKASGMPLDS